jgi:predicted RNA-binding Zn ribbon-like protein
MAEFASQGSVSERHMLRFRFGIGTPWVDFAATLGARDGRRPVERLRTADDLVRWVQDAGFSSRATVSPAQLEAAIALRESIYRAADTSRTGRPIDPTDIASINAWAAEPALAPQLASSAGGQAWAGAGTIDEVLAMVAQDAVRLLVSPLRQRLRRCADAECGAVFVDLSRPGNRRWCSMSTCGNRAKKRALRAHTAVRGARD